MALTYSSILHYTFTNSSNQKKEFKVPICLFSVAGGPKRVIELRNRDDVSIVSELEQARTYKNIVLGMPPMRGSGDMQVTLDLTNAAASKSDVHFSFCVFKFQNKTCIEGFHLFTEAKLKEPPKVVSGLLQLYFTLDGSAELRRVIYNPGKQPKSFQM